MLVNFSITSAGMLAGADYMFKNFFGIGFKIPSLVLSLICFLITQIVVNKQQDIQV